MTKPRIFLIEDNKMVRETVTEMLIEDGYDVTTASCASEVTTKLPTVKPNAILLDIKLPDGNGLNLIPTIKQYTDVPVIVISGKSDMVDKVVGLEMGADDYVGKPLYMKEVSARLKAQLRRYADMTDAYFNGRPSKKEPHGKVRFGPWTLDHARMQVYDSNDISANLTTGEFRLLEALVNAPNIVLSRQQLLDKVQGDNDITDRAIDVQILRIRRKINDAAETPTIIQAVRGVGYMLICETNEL